MGCGGRNATAGFASLRFHFASLRFHLVSISLDFASSRRAPAGRAGRRAGGFIFLKPSVFAAP
jgi:hypothetical protein